MSRFAVILIATLSTGCVSTVKQDLAERSSPVPYGGWQQLGSILRDAPAALRTVIMQEGEAQSPDVNALQEPLAVLNKILTHTHNLALLPDAEFASLQHVVSGENRQLEQSYAAVLSAYLTQSGFACRQPLYAEYFRRRYPAAHTATPCSEEVPFSVLTRYDGAQIIWLDPHRVKSIHLLFAGKSRSMASRFGHVALRLVVCPVGKTTASECDVNLSEHVVLGFRAHIDELSLDTLKALNGEYKAYLFANRFMDVYADYAIGEFREVYSLPLRLEDAQRELIVRELADIHWRYAGKYSFFTRNCATMMQDALRAAWPEFADSAKMAHHYQRPDSLFAAIRSSPLAESDRLVSLELAERDGYYFSSTRQLYALAVNTVRAEMHQSAFTDLDEYLQIHPIKRRQARAEDQKYLARLSSDRHLREAQIMLEEYAIMRSERAMIIEGARYIEQQDFLTRADSILAQLDADHARQFEECLLAPIREHARPLLRMGGIPEKSDIPKDSGQVSHCQSAQSRKLMRESIAEIKDAKSEQWRRLNAVSLYWMESIENLNVLKQM